MIYSYGLYGSNNRPYEDYYLNCGFRSVYSKQRTKTKPTRKEVDKLDLVNQLWENVKSDLKNNTSETIYSVWFSELALDTFGGDSVVLTDDPFRCKIINEKFIPLLEESFERVMGFRVVVTVTPKQEKQKPQEPVTYSTNELYTPAANECTFENFIVGNSNKFAHAAALSVASDPGNTYNPLFIYGNSGLGKTHLLNAICNEILKNNPDAYIIYVRSEDFMNELIDYLQNKKDTSVFHNKYRNADVLLVDDVQFIAGKPSTELEFFHTFDTLIKAKAQIVLTSDRPPKEMATLEERLRGRFESGLIADIQPPDLETRVAIINCKAESLGISITQSLVLFIAEKIKNNIRQLEGAVKNMKAYMDIGEPMNLATAQKAIRDIFSEGDPTPVLIDRIIDEVARTYGVTVAEIKGKKHDAKIVLPRHVAMYLIRENTPLTNKKVAELFGLSDHSSVMYAYRRISTEKENNYSLKTILADITKNVTES
ncbi:MAG: chromosomal replication initiator protein DnaA [Clostridia bacterium]|nr:chromosomal replication initiator protein DnaA [Clostridia bacterium]